MAESETLLLVVPELRRRTDYVEALGGSGWRVLQAPTAGIALTRCERERPRIVVTDVVLPGIPGVDIARALRVCAGDAPLVILGLLPQCFADSDIAAAAISFDRLLHEPLHADVLVRSVLEAQVAAAIASRTRAARSARTVDPVVYAS